MSLFDKSGEQYYDLTNWAPYASALPPYDMSLAGAVQISSDLLKICGGLVVATNGTRTVTASCYTFNMKKHVFTESPDLIIARFGHTIVNLQGTLDWVGYRWQSSCIFLWSLDVLFEC